MWHWHVQHNHNMIHNHVSWNSCSFNIQEPSVERPSPSKLRLRRGNIIIVIKNNIEQKKKNSLRLKSLQMFYTCTEFLHWLTSEHHWKIQLLYPVSLSTSHVGLWMNVMPAPFCSPSQRQSLALVFMKEDPFGLL